MSDSLIQGHWVARNSRCWPAFNNPSWLERLYRWAIFDHRWVPL